MLVFAAVVPWLTFRGLHTDRLEGFSADHRLTFRGLPAEGLGDCSREAASRSTLVAANQGLLSSPQEGLSWAAQVISWPEGGLLGVLEATPFPVSVFRGDAVEFVSVSMVLGMFVSAAD